MDLRLTFSNKTAYTLLMVLFVLLGGLLVYSYTQPLPNPGHGGDTILISVNGMEKTLQQALNDGDLGGGGPFDFELSNEMYFGCGTFNVTGVWHACFLVNVKHDDQGDDSDFTKRVYNVSAPDAEGKMAWKAQNLCPADSVGSAIRCFNINHP